MLCRCAVVNAKKKEKKRKHIGWVCTHVRGKTAEVVNKESRWDAEQYKDSENVQSTIAAFYSDSKHVYMLHLWIAL